MADNMSWKRKAELLFNGAVQKQAEGDVKKADQWLARAAIAELEAIKEGEEAPVI